MSSPATSTYSAAHR
jgi:hypothetical protein